MARTALKDSSNRTIGYIDDKPNEQVGYDASNRKKGRYDKKQNKTYDASNRMIGTGNLLTNLILAP